MKQLAENMPTRITSILSIGQGEVEREWWRSGRGGDTTRRCDRACACLRLFKCGAALFQNGTAAPLDNAYSGHCLTILKPQGAASCYTSCLRVYRQNVTSAFAGRRSP